MTTLIIMLFIGSALAYAGERLGSSILTGIAAVLLLSMAALA